MIKFTKAVGFVARVQNGYAFITSAEVGSAFVNPELFKTKGLEKGAQVVFDAEEEYVESKDAFGFNVKAIHSVKSAQKATAFAKIKWFDSKKGYGIATLLQGDHEGRGVFFSRQVADMSGFEAKTGMPIRVVYFIQHDGASEKLEAESYETGSDVAKAMKQALGNKPVLKVVANDTDEPEEDAEEKAA